MKYIVIGCSAILASIALSNGAFSATTDQIITAPSKVIEHGGGCRKSSPPGQCCHMDNSAGSVHCH